MNVRDDSQTHSNGLLLSCFWFGLFHFQKCCFQFVMSLIK
uniref:Uncharacterized protein n=1 Tax=Anguilla anguilla TaxID=7936 RepID=A0A0E9SFG3_ANGAN